MRKHALSSQGGKAIAHGDPELAKPLVRALEASREEPDTLTHGFHSYPARMHPAIARRVLQSYPGGLVVDPFCGSGTSSPLRTKTRTRRPSRTSTRTRLGLLSVGSTSITFEASM